MDDAINFIRSLETHEQNHILNQVKAASAIFIPNTTELFAKRIKLDGLNEAILRAYASSLFTLTSSEMVYVLTAALLTIVRMSEHEN